MTSTLARWVLSGAGAGKGDLAGYRFDDGETPSYITHDDTFWATVAHYAELHKVDKDHLAETLLTVGRRNEPVTADGIWATARALALHVAG